MKYLILILFISFTIFGCGQKIDRESAAVIMNESGCWWSYDLKLDAERLMFKDPYWVLSVNYCLGECRVNSVTGEFEKDVNPMCMGANLD